MNKKEIQAKIKTVGSPLARQLLMTGLITRLLEEQGKEAPVLIGGLALSYYTREVYFTSDIDLAYADREALDAVLKSLDFVKKGRYWIQHELDMAVEVPTDELADEKSPLESVELDFGLRCVIIGVEDLLIDRLNACKHWNSQIDCEMAELLIAHYSKELDWTYLKGKAELPENDTLSELMTFKKKRSS